MTATTMTTARVLTTRMLATYDDGKPGDAADDEDDDNDDTDALHRVVGGACTVDEVCDDSGPGTSEAELMVGRHVERRRLEDVGSEDR
jgi:hypothetical protein